MHGGKKQIFACEWISPLAWKAAVASGIDIKLPRREEQIIHSLFCRLSEAVSQRLLVGAPQELCISPSPDSDPNSMTGPRHCYFHGSKVLQLKK